MLSWVGDACHMPPRPGHLALTRKQDPTALNEAGKSGLPLLIIHGTRDLIFDGDALIANMASRFTDCETVLLDGVGHMPFYE
jgi:pimeloyl-ACP methyl ester carboxylesterase